MRRLLVLNAVLLVWLFPAPARSGSGDLFVPREAAADSPSPSPPGLVRARPVHVDLRSLPGADGISPPPRAGHVLRLNLFDDAVLSARMTRVGRMARGLRWSGRLVGAPLSSVEIVVYDGITSGSINTGAASYRISWDGIGHVVQEVDYDQFPEEHDCALDYFGEPYAPDDPEAQIALDDGSLVDVMVVYTPAARAAAGGTSAMLSLINLAVSETNTGYADSNVVQRIRLVHTAEVALTESNISSDLDILTNVDGVIDEVHTLRDTYGADMVSLFGEGYVLQGACGVAWLMAGNNPAFESHAFSVVDRTCATGYYSFGHEMGHNQGLNHARVDPVGTGAYSYSYGYKDPDEAFRTVMAYNCSGPGGCPRVAHYSNPEVTYGGDPTGILHTAPDSADNARSLNNTRVTVANWRSRNPTLTVTSPDGGESWPVGSVQAVTWTSAELDPDATITLTYADDLSTWPIASGLDPDTTTYDWTIPANPGSGYTVTVCSEVSSTCEASGESDGAFSIISSVTYDLTVTPPAHGTVTSVDGHVNCGTGGSACGYAYDEGTDVDLNATPDAGYAFVNWTGDCSGLTCALTMDVDHSVGAAFNVLPVDASIDDPVGLTEGDCGTSNLTFTVTLASASLEPVTVTYQTQDGTALQGEDYTLTSGTLTFNPGVTSLPIDVPIVGDPAFEGDETFTVELTVATNATLVDNSGTGTILNDDRELLAGEVAVSWTGDVGVTVCSNSLTKTAVNGWGNAGAVSDTHLASGDGYVEFTPSGTNTYRMLGLSNGDTNASYEDIDFGLDIWGNGQITVYENGVYRGNFGAYATGDKLRVAVVGSVVEYSRNGTVFYTSTQTPVHPLLVDTSLYNTGATLSSVAVSGFSAIPPPPPSVVWTSAVGVSVNGNSLTKTGAAGWNAGAVSDTQLASGDGYVEFTASETNTYRMLGLSFGDGNASYQDIDFGLDLWANGQITVYENGIYRGNFGAYATGDKLRVAVVGGVVEYSRNGTVFYTSTQTPVYPLLVDTSLYNTGATLSSAVVSGFSAPPPPPPSVVWTSAVGVSVNGNSLTKTGAAGWNAGAVSDTQITSGDGYVEFTASETNTYRMLGLSFGDGNASYQDIDFGLDLWGNGQITVYENGIYRGNFGAYATGDKLRVAVVGSVVEYSRNGTVFYTSSQTPVYPLLVDTSLYNTGATLSSVVVSGFSAIPPPAWDPVVWTSAVGVTVDGNSLTKTGAAGWNAGAVSSQQIASGDGYVEFTASETNTFRMLGLSNGNTNASYQDVDFGLDLWGNGQITVYENGVYRGNFGAYATGDKLRVAVAGSVVEYSRNGTVFYASSQTPVYPLLVDTSLYNTGATLSNVIIDGAE